MSRPTPADRGRRAVRAVRVVLGIVVAATLLDVAPPSARAQEAAPAAALAGYQGTAAASGVHLFYNPEGLLPVPPPIDVGAPDALATIASGPATFARASVLDPGDLLASPEALLALAAPDYPGGIIPPYPFRISATSGVGAPVVESNPAPGLQARVEVGEGTSTATASLPAVNAPAVVRVGSMSARATTETDGSSVTVRSVTEIAGVDVLGVLHIDAVVTELAATSSGGEPELTGGTRVVGASILGQPVTIDADGIHAAPGGPPLLRGVLRGIVNRLGDVLAQIGVSITVAGPVEATGGDSGELLSTGLRIALELSGDTFPALAALIDALPPFENPLPGVPSIEDLLAVASARHLVAVEVGRGSVSLLARTTGAAAPSGPAGPTTPTSGFPSGGGPVALPPVSVSPSLPPAVDLPGPVSGAASELPSGAGVGALVLLAVLSMPFVGDRISRVCAAVLATDRSATCTWEGR